MGAIFANSSSHNDSYENHLNHEERTEVPDAGDPSSGPIRCNAYLKRIAAVIVGLFVYTLLGIPAMVLLFVGIPWALCDRHLTIQRQGILKASYKPLNNWDRKDYIVAFCWGLTIPFALPFMGLNKSKILETVIEPTLDYPKKLWTEANEQLAVVDASSRRGHSSK